MEKRDDYSADKLSCTRTSSTGTGLTNHMQARRHQLSIRVGPIKLLRGDVRELRIHRNKRTTHLVVCDENRAVPPI
jgi:hypothetical protein